MSALETGIKLESPSLDARGMVLEEVFLLIVLCKVSRKNSVLADWYFFLERVSRYASIGYPPRLFSTNSLFKSAIARLRAAIEVSEAVLWK